MHKGLKNGGLRVAGVRRLGMRRAFSLGSAGSPGDARTSQPAPEVSTEQDVDEGVDAAGGVAQTHGQVVAGVVGQGGPSHRQVDQLQDVVGPHAQQEHPHQNQHRLGQADGPSAWQVGAVAVKCIKGLKRGTVLCEIHGNCCYFLLDIYEIVCPC